MIVFIDVHFENLFPNSSRLRLLSSLPASSANSTANDDRESAFRIAMAILFIEQHGKSIAIPLKHYQLSECPSISGCNLAEKQCLQSIPGCQNCNHKAISFNLYKRLINSKSQVKWIVNWVKDNNNDNLGSAWEHFIDIQMNLIYLNCWAKYASNKLLIPSICRLI